jgi:hypothetical protein
MTRRIGPVCLIVGTVLLAACRQADTGSLVGTEQVAPADFAYLGQSRRCVLQVGLTQPRALTVNCFHLDGVLAIHSNRFAKMPRLSGESWVDTVRRETEVRVSIDGDIFRMRAHPVNDEARRLSILHQRGYYYAWDGITIFTFTPAVQPP